MSEKIRAVRLQASDDWFPATPPALHAPEGKPLSCNDSFVISKRAPNVRCVLSAHTSALRRSSLVLRLVLSAAADVFIHIDDDEVASQHLVRDGAALQTITADLTPWAEATQHVEIRVDIRFSDEEGTAGIFESSGPCGTVVVQPFDWRYATVAAMFFLASALVLIGGAIGVAGIASRLDATLRTYALLVSAAVWLYHVIGLPNISSLDLRILIRRLFSWCMPFRALAAAMLLIIASATTFHAFTVVDALVQRAAYTAAFSEGQQLADQQKAISAFVHFPWRPEGQFLIETYLYAYRETGLARMREVATSITSNRYVQQAVASPESRYKKYLDPKYETSDPALWYASLVLDSDNSASRQLALGTLASRKDDEARTLRALLKLTAAEGKDEKTAAAAAEELKAILRHVATGRFATTYAFQNAADAIASRAIRDARHIVDGCIAAGCTSAADAIKTDLDAAVENFRRVIKARSDLGRQMAWQRPPEKLNVFHILASVPSDQGPGPKAAQAFIGNFRYCAGFVPGYDGRLKEQILANYSDYDKATTWITPSATAPAFLAGIKDKTLNEGWRY